MSKVTLWWLLVGFAVYDAVAVQIVQYYLCRDAYCKVIPISMLVKIYL